MNQPHPIVGFADAGYFKPIATTGTPPYVLVDATADDGCLRGSVFNMTEANREALFGADYGDQFILSGWDWLGRMHLELPPACGYVPRTQAIDAYNAVLNEDFSRFITYYGLVEFKIDAFSGDCAAHAPYRDYEPALSALTPCWGAWQVVTNESQVARVFPIR